MSTNKPGEIGMRLVDCINVSILVYDARVLHKVTIGGNWTSVQGISLCYFLQLRVNLSSQ